MLIFKHEISAYRTREGEVPFEEWLTHLRDRKAVARIKIRIDRVRLGTFGEHRFVGQGVWELKIDYGPGYRVYFAHEGARVILLLCGGDKRTQDKDIREAHEYWVNYKKRKQEI